MRACLSASLLLAFVIFPMSAASQEAEGFTWENTSELSFVATGGNASSSTLGLKSTLIGTGAPNAFKFEIGGIRAESEFTTRRAVGTVDDFLVTEAKNSEVTAESYFARGRYDHTFDGLFLFTGAGWDRNTFAGIQNRYALSVGFGRSWIESETSRFKTDIGGTYTIQKDVDPTPGQDEGFGGARITIDAMKQLSATTEFASVLIVDDNLEDTEDLRADWLNSLSVSISESLALKTSLQLLFDNQPSMIGVDLESPGGSSTGETVLIDGEELDTVFTVALVIKL
jgi:putative salt-induced outer membrane protein YdiY